MLEFDYTLILRAITAFTLAATFTLLCLGIGTSKVKEILISSGEMEPHQSSWLMPLIILLVVLAAILASPVVAISTVGLLSTITTVTNLVRLLKTY